MFSLQYSSVYSLIHILQYTVLYYCTLFRNICTVATIKYSTVLYCIANSYEKENIFTVYGYNIIIYCVLHMFTILNAFIEKNMMAK